MEIKTCEQYVLNRLTELEELVEVQKSLLATQSDIISDFREQLDVVSNLLSIKKAHDWSTENTSTYITFDSVWKKFDFDTYEFLCDAFGLVEPDDEEEEDE